MVNMNRTVLSRLVGDGDVKLNDYGVSTVTVTANSFHTETVVVPKR